MGAQEWRDSFSLRYRIKTTDLPHIINWCVKTFFITRALDCNKGGLVTTLHNKLCDRVSDLDIKASTTLYVYNKHLIHTGSSMKIVKY